MPRDAIPPGSWAPETRAAAAPAATKARNSLRFISLGPCANKNDKRPAIEFIFAVFSLACYIEADFGCANNSQSSCAHLRYPKAIRNNEPHETESQGFHNIHLPAGFVQQSEFA